MFSSVVTVSSVEVEAVLRGRGYAPESERPLVIAPPPMTPPPPPAITPPWQPPPAITQPPVWEPPAPPFTTPAPAPQQDAGSKDAMKLLIIGAAVVMIAT